MSEVIIHSVVMDDLPYIILLSAIVIFVLIGIIITWNKKDVSKGRRAYIYIVLAVVFASSVWSLSRYIPPVYDYIAKDYKTAEGCVTGYTSDEKKYFIYIDGYPYRISTDIYKQEMYSGEIVQYIFGKKSLCIVSISKLP